MKKSALVLLSALLALTVATPAMALLLPLTYSNVNGSGTYGTLELTNISGGGGVQVAANYNSTFFGDQTGNTSFGVQDVYLNLLNPTLAGSIGFEQVGEQNDGGIDPSDTPNAGTWSLVTTGAALKPDGLGYFTLNATSNGGANHRIPIDTSASGNFTPLFNLTAADLTVDDFVAFSKDKNENPLPWYGAMHLAGYPANPAGTDHTSAYLAASTAVPIPSAVWLLGSGIIGLIGLKRRANKREKLVS